MQTLWYALRVRFCDAFLPRRCAVPYAAVRCHVDKYFADTCGTACSMNGALGVGGISHSGISQCACPPQLMTTVNARRHRVYPGYLATVSAAGTMEQRAPSSIITKHETTTAAVCSTTSSTPPVCHEWLTSDSGRRMDELLPRKNSDALTDNALDSFTTPVAAKLKLQSH